jgi:hypothetical protein
MEFHSDGEEICMDSTAKFNRTSLIQALSLALGWFLMMEMDSVEIMY